MSATGGPRPTRLGDDGYATVAVAGVGALVMVALLAVVALTSVVADQHRARTSADLAALAAGVPLLVGDAPDCAAAARVADSMGAGLAACGPGPDASVIVETSVRLRIEPALAGGVSSARAMARAGVVPLTD